MKTKSEIKNELINLAAQEGLTGIVTDSLLNILTYYLFEQQAEEASAVLESSIDTCTKLNSLISHAIGYMYNLPRQECKKVVLLNYPGDYSSGGYNYHDLVYNSSNFKLIYEGIKITQDGATATITSLVGGTKETIIEYEYDSERKYYELDESNISFLDIYYLNNGKYELFSNIYEEFSEYYNEITSSNKPAIFILNTPDNGARIYVHSGSSLNLKVVTYSCTDYVPNEKEVESITASNEDYTVLPENWSNNNISDKYYSSNDLGTSYNPYISTYDVSRIDYTEGKNIAFLGERVVDFEDKKSDFMLYLGKGFVDDRSKNIIEAFYDFAEKGSSNRVDASVVRDTSNTYDGMSINSPIYCLVYGDPDQSLAGPGEESQGKSVVEFLNEHPNYLSYNWVNDEDGRWIQEYDNTSSKLPTNILEIHSGVLSITLHVSSDTYYDPDDRLIDRSTLKRKLSTLLSDYYANRLLSSNGNGYSVYDSTILSIISGYKISLDSISMSYNRTNIIKSGVTSDESSATSALTTTIYGSDGVLKILGSVGSINYSNRTYSNKRRSENYAFISEVELEVELNN